MKKLKIGQISPLNLAVPPKKYGGTERIIYWLCQELTKKGHQVFLFGTGDSRVSCHLIPVVKTPLWVLKPEDYAPYYAYQMAVIGKKAKELKLDVLHDHLGPWALTLYGNLNCPILHTLHVPFKNRDRIWAYEKLNTKLVSISLAQRKPAPYLNYVANIYNGIDIEKFQFSEKPGDYYCWAGELSPRKGIFEVIKLAKMTRIRLILAGRIPPPQQKEDYIFFKKYIEKDLKRKRINYIGELTEKELVKFYSKARAFLYPLQWEEPFGLTMVEAMACGTPVITFKRGSMAEVIKNRKTGFVVSPFTKKKKVNYAGLIEAMRNIERISRAECRKWVEQKFTKEKMVAEYEKLYYRLLK